MRYYPESALVQLEFDKIRNLLAEHTRTAYARTKAENLRIHTRRDFIENELRQSHEYKLLLEASQYFPNDFTDDLSRPLKLVSIPGALLTPEDLVGIRRMVYGIRDIFRWFDAERKTAYPALASVISNSYYEKDILQLIDEVLDEPGHVKDQASENLLRIRSQLYRTRNELRRTFEKVVQKWSKAGYVADIEEAFLNGRRVVALHAEYKRQVRGILLGESDTRKTAFLEPEETIELNNEIFTLENEERQEIYRILKELTARLSAFASLLGEYHSITGEFDFIRAKARLARDLGGHFPQISEQSDIRLIDAFHPLLYLYNKQSNKATIPTRLTLDERNRILLISGPNAGGKTVTLKTVGLLQLMLQSGLLVPVHPHSEFGVFKQIMIHIGDTQSLEFDLSTYSAHLQHMKFFIENANGRTLFFIDELGSGSDPSLGGAFAEVILEELVKKHARGIVTTHYLNLKVMAGKTSGIVNGAMAFDEERLQPLYKLHIGQPGSSYTFSIAERIGLDKRLIERARSLVDEGHFRLDKLLNRAEQDLQQIEKKEKHLQQLIRENQQLKKEMQTTLEKEKHQQQVEMLKEQNRLSTEKIAYLRDMERKLKQIISDWKKAEEQDDKKALMKQLQILLFGQQKKQSVEKAKKKIQTRFEETGRTIEVGTKALMKKNHQVGEVKEIRGKKAILQVGLLPITVNLDDLVAVVEKSPDEKSRS